jgi:hypothetical protein
VVIIDHEMFNFLFARFLSSFFYELNDVLIYMQHKPVTPLKRLSSIAGRVLCFSFVLACSASSAMQAGKRVGIVIGNTQYKTSPLINPRNDAMAMSRFLRSQGFDVSEFLDLPTQQISELSDVVRRKVDSDTTLVVFYAGHGMQIEGRNYLPSPDASLSNLNTLRAGSISLDNLLGMIHSFKPRASVVILDACRDNPFAVGAVSKETPKGLARAIAPPGTVIFYATRPGSTASDGSGANGLFTEHLLREVTSTNLPLELVFRRVSNSVYKASRGEQEPWVEGVIREEIVLTASPMSVAVLPPLLPLSQPANAPLPVPSTTLSSVAATPVQPMTPFATENAIFVPQISRPGQDRLKSIQKSEALLVLNKLNLNEEKLATRFICRDDLCEPYEEAFRQMRTDRSLPTLPAGKGVMRLCEFDLTENRCKNDFLSHGTGVSPVALFAKMMGTSVNTRQLVLSEVQNSNGGGLVFSTEPQITIMRSRLGVSNDIGCRLGTGRLEMMPDHVELELAQNICFQATPPVPWQYKLSMEVLIFDLSNMQALVRWRQRGISLGMYMSSEGIAKVSFE